jgi:hypothetical protein
MVQRNAECRRVLQSDIKDEQAEFETPMSNSEAAAITTLSTTFRTAT